MQKHHFLRIDFARQDRELRVPRARCMFLWAPHAKQVRKKSRGTRKVGGVFRGARQKPTCKGPPVPCWGLPKVPCWHHLAPTWRKIRVPPAACPLAILYVGGTYLAQALVLFLAKDSNNHAVSIDSGISLTPSWQRRAALISIGRVHSRNNAGLTLSPCLPGPYHNR